MTTYNFAAGPAMLPPSVLEQVCADIPDWYKGMSVMEIGHRTPPFNELAEALKQKIKTLLKVPDSHTILLMPGGARMQFALLPMNFISKGQQANYVQSGYWSESAALEAKRVGNVHIAASSESKQYQQIPIDKEWQISQNAAYVHYTDNETIHGVEFHQTPNIEGIPLLTDMTSSLLAKPIAVEKYSLIYASAQKNIGPAGLTVVILDKSFAQRATPGLPKMFDYTNWLETDSMYNTPATFSWYVANLVMDWLIKEGGVEAIYRKNQKKSEKLYQFIDESDFYQNTIEASSRSRMNIPFLLADSTLEERFLEKAEEQGLMQLKGHRLVGGLRASLYNAMPESGVDALIKFMKDFQRQA